jgi:hypothetical protein
MKKLTSQAAIEVAQIIRANQINGEALSTDARAIEARLSEAEFQLGEGNPASIEIKARDSVHGVVQDIELSSACTEDTFKVGYYKADLVDGVTYIGAELEDEETEIDTPVFFQNHLDDADFTEMITFLDESTKSIFEKIEAEYGVKF